MYRNVILTTSFMFFILLLSSCEKESTNSNKPNISIDSILTYIENYDPSFATIKDKNRLILFLNFEDFSCPLCFDDFINLCDQINNTFSLEAQTHIDAVFHQRDFINFENPKKLQSWKEANNINFNTLIIADSVFEKIELSKSTAIVIDRKKNVILFEHIPMGVEKHNLIISLLLKNQ